VADEVGARSVAFPLVSAGIYGWPFEDAVRAAADTLTSTTTSVEIGRIVTFGASTYERVVKVTGL
jgi:O-acetyl-ADP-ribose deacetylase (regulator of RNase III)